MFEAKDYVTLGMSALALVVSGSLAVSNFSFNRQKAARDLWQKNLELYLANPTHVLGKPKDDTETSKQAYRIHVALIFMALEEIIKVFPRDAGWMGLVRRHVARHAEFVRELRNDPDRLEMYSHGLRKRMMEIG